MKFILVILVSIVLFGCSDGGKSKKTEPKVSVTELDPNNIPQERQAEWNEYVTVTQTRMSDSIIGVLDASNVQNGKTDTTYLIVEEIQNSNDLKISAFNYMLDDVDKEGNCYRLATGSMVNAKLNDSVAQSGTGSILTWKAPYATPSKKGTFYTTIDNLELSWNFDLNDNIETISRGSISSATTLSIFTSDLKLVVPKTPSGSPLVTISSIKSNICTGEVVDENAIGSTNFAGLYDVTLEDSNKTYETYLYIDAKGSMLAYKYMADDFALDPKNCYSPSYLYNKSLHDRTLKYDSANKRFYALVGQNTYYWNLDDNGNIIGVSKNAEVATSSVVSVDDEISIGITKETAFTLTDLQNNLCL